jgi:hypothetical protein
MEILGRYDRVDLPGLKLKNIHAKVDTGAYRCSLHCQSATLVNGVLEFVLLDAEHPEFTGRKFKATEFHERDIKNSFGETERRYVITTTIKIFNEEITADFSLSNRGSLKFPILLGRKILQQRFLIDVKKKNLSYKAKQQALRARRKRKKIG